MVLGGQRKPINLVLPDSSGADLGVSAFALCLSSFSFNGSFAASAGGSEEGSGVDSGTGLASAEGSEAGLLPCSYNKQTTALQQRSTHTAWKRSELWRQLGRMSTSVKTSWTSSVASLFSSFVFVFFGTDVAATGERRSENITHIYKYMIDRR